MSEYDDGKGHVWTIVKEYPATDRPGSHPTFLATWKNKVGFINVSLFVRGRNNIWMTSIDGPFSNSQIRTDRDRIKDES